VKISTLILAATVSIYPLSAGQESVIDVLSGDYARLNTSNNITLRGKIAEHYGDNFNTGTLLLEMKRGGSIYGLNLIVYTQNYPENRKWMTPTAI